MEQNSIGSVRLVHIAEKLSSNVLSASLIVIEDTRRGGLKPGKSVDTQANTIRPDEPG